MAKQPQSEKAPPILDGFVQLYAIIDGEFYDAINCHFVYQMNAIPYGEVNLAVGTNLKTLKPSEIHARLGSMKEGTPVTVMLEVQSKDKSQKVPNGEFKLMEGYLAGRPGVLRTINGAAAINIGVLHWLRDLDFTSVMSRSFTPDAVDALYLPPGFKISELNADSSAASIPGVMELLKDFEEDAWKSINTVLTYLAEGSVKLDRFQEGARNDEALRALRRFNGAGVTPGKLAVAEEFLPLADAMKISLAEIIFSTLGGGTAWNKILQCAALLDFAIIPTVNSATAAPHAFSPRDYFIDIPAEDCFHVEIAPFMDRTLGGMILLGTGGNEYDERDRFLFERKIIGLVRGDEKESLRGNIAIKHAHKWVSDSKLGPSMEFTRSWISESPNNAMQRPRNIKIDQQREELQKISDSLNSLGNSLVEYYFTNERVRMRQGVLVGRLRFDVSPGASIQVSGTLPDLQLGGATDAFYANVHSVEYHVDVNQPQISTILQLNAIQTAEEAVAAKNSVEKHPMYAEKWFGSDLLTSGFFSETSPNFE